MKLDGVAGAVMKDRMEDNGIGARELDQGVQGYRQQETLEFSE